MSSFELYDFDEAFSHYLQKWYENNFGRFRTYDEMEDYAPEVYQEFLDAPAAFLNGRKPGEFFNSYDNPGQLVNWLAEYVRKDVSVPDMLLNRISDLGEAAAPALMHLLSDSQQPDELRMHLISLLREIDSPLPYPLFVEWIAHWDGQDELTENAVETLENAEKSLPDVFEKIRASYEDATVAGKTAFLSILSRDPKNADMAEAAVRLFEHEPQQQIYLAAILARFGRSIALPALKRAALDRNTGYLLYIELRSAIEALGGEAPRRTFAEDDPEYDSMRALENNL